MLLETALVDTFARRSDPHSMMKVFDDMDRKDASIDNSNGNGKRATESYNEMLWQELKP